MKRQKSYTTNYLLQHPDIWMSLLSEKEEPYWIQRGENMAVSLFTRMRKKVPAYRSFLQMSEYIGGSQLDFQTIPTIDKNSYLRKFPLEDLSWDGAFTSRQETVAATSGSTGEPFYFPRGLEQDKQYAAIAEMYLRSNFDIQHKKTLYIIGWGMGVWIGGIFSFAAARIVAERGKYPLSVITTGISEEEILKAVKTLGPLYDQIIIGGYPPMIKDLIDQGLSSNIGWKNYPVKFIFSAEGFSERFRDYIVEQTGLQNVYLDTLNHYGTVDLGTMAHETPLSIMIRRLACNRPELNMDLFGHPYRQPTLAQYIPELYYFEEYDHTLLCSARSGLPLVRYDLLDTGGVITQKKVAEIFANHGLSLSEEVLKHGIHKTVWNLPFVYVFERGDFTVKLYGANIYPQEIRRALEQDVISKSVTGRFTMAVTYDEQVNQRFTVDIELRPGVLQNPSLEASVTNAVLLELLSHNSEFANNYQGLGKEKNTPIIHLVGYGQAPHFARTGKHRWVRKSLP